MKKFFNWSNIRLLLIIIGIISLYSFALHKNEHRKLTKSKVEFIGKEKLFVTHEMVNKLLIENKSDASSIEKVTLDLNDLEKNINKHNMIEKSQVFVSIDGTLKAVVKQKTPTVRIFSELESYYLDYKGTKMPLSNSFTAHVPLLMGQIDDENKENLANFVRVIYDDDFLRKNIIGIKISSNGDIILKNRGYDFDIVFGKLINEELKFKNYKAFLHKAIEDSTINKYRSINLKFTKQVVCTK